MPTQFSGARLYQPLGLACGTLADPPRKSGAAAAFVAWRLRFASSWRFASGNCCRAVQSPPRRRSGPAALERLARCAVAGASEAGLCNVFHADPPPSLRAGVWWVPAGRARARAPLAVFSGGVSVVVPGAV